MNQYISLRNQRFLLHEWLNVSALQQYDYYADYDKEGIDMLLDAAKQIADTTMFPFNKDMDRFKVTVEDGVTKVHPQLRVIIKALADGGWISAHVPYNYGGAQMPLTVLNAGLMTFYAAGVNASYAFLTSGAANLILSFGSEALKTEYLPNMYNGAWQGTMALTEPQAGSSLTDITASASLQADGTYKIKGQKIYISGGDHDAVDNIIHLTLAKIDGAPAGTKGISLFVVPKNRAQNGGFTPNDVTTAGVYGKMGQKNYTAAHLMFGEKDDCIGHIVGEPHQGLIYMFQMMNEARIATGLMACGNAMTAYYASLNYAQVRPQGRHLSQKDPLLPQVIIIEHAEVRRKLLLQKAITEGSAALLMYCSQKADIVNVTSGEEKANAHLMLELLTPIAKSYPSELGIVSVKEAMQVLGGAGYCDDFSIEQIYREIPINTIYEGTTSIHGLDLLGRKVMMEKGKALALFAAELTNTVTKSLASETLRPLANKLGQTAQKLNECTKHLIELAMTEKPEIFTADATLYLEYFGNITIAWLWLEQALIAEKALQTADNEGDVNFYNGKIQTAIFYFEYELPKTRPLHDRLMSNVRVTLDIALANIC